MRALAIDLGTANTVVVAPGRGVILDEPSVLALDERGGRALGLGMEALRLVREPGGPTTLVHPVRGGTITDYDLTALLFRAVLARVGAGRLLHPRAIVTVSETTSPVERRAVEEAMREAGARDVWLIEHAMAAALGSELAIERAAGSCIADIGAGTTEVAVISLGSVVASRAVRVGGSDIDDAIRAVLREVHGVAVGERTAEAIKREIGSAVPAEDEPQAEIQGRDIHEGLPRTITVGAEEIRTAIAPVVDEIIEAVRAAIAAAPPELAHDVLEGGLTLAGGTALLPGLGETIEAETGIPVHVTTRPREAGARGAGVAMGNVAHLRDHGILTR